MRRETGNTTGCERGGQSAQGYGNTKKQRDKGERNKWGRRVYRETQGLKGTR